MCKRLIILIFVMTSVICSLEVKASFSGSFTEITWTWAFDKVHWRNKILKVYEDILVNPFEGTEIMKVDNMTNWRLVSTVYTVDWMNLDYYIRIKNIFLWSTYANWNKYWYTDSVWNDIKVVDSYFLEDTVFYSWWILLPQQEVLARVMYDVTFNYDLTPPVCLNTDLYYDEGMSIPYTWGVSSWINKPLWYTIECYDPEVWCREDNVIPTAEENLLILKKYVNSIDLTPLCTNRKKITWFLRGNFPNTKFSILNHNILGFGLIPIHYLRDLWSYPSKRRLFDSSINLLPVCSWTIDFFTFLENTFKNITYSRLDYINLIWLNPSWDVVSSPKKLYNNVIPKARFTNNVNLTSLCEWRWGVVSLLDENFPSIDFALWIHSDDDSIETSWLYYFDSNNSSNRTYINTWIWINHYSLNNDLEVLALEDTITFSIKDIYYPLGTSWVSWIENYKIEVFDTTNSSKCLKTETFPPYNSTGSILMSDEKKINLSCLDIQVAWDYKIIVEATDFANNKTKIEANFTVYPNLIDQTNTWVSLNWGEWTKYADNIDKYSYILHLRDKFDNPIYDKNALSLIQNRRPSGKTIKLDIRDLSSDYAISEIDYSESSTDLWLITFDLISSAPWEFSQTFNLKIENWDNEYVNNSSFSELYIWNRTGVENIFLKPFSWSGYIDWLKTPIIRKEQKYIINLVKDTTNSFNFSNWNLDLSTSSIPVISPWYFWIGFSVINNDFGDYLSINDTSFSWSIEVGTNDFSFSWISKVGTATGITSFIDVASNDLLISYKLWGKDIKYYLDDFPVSSWCSTGSLWVNILWNVSWNINSDTIWNTNPFSTAFNSELRWEVKKNIYKLISSLNAWDLVWWVKYVEWDYTMSWSNLWFETLIIKNWNLIVDWNINTMNDKLWIIIISDNYSVENDYDNIWNIYINKDVTSITATIYSDWTLRSADSSWNSYLDSELGTKISFHWSLFSRNTIWWSTGIWWSYMLPWGKRTYDYDLSKIYDLDLLRQVDWTCSLPSYSFELKYNPNIQLDPPKWFEIY